MLIELSMLSVVTVNVFRTILYIFLSFSQTLTVIFMFGAEAKRCVSVCFLFGLRSQRCSPRSLLRTFHAVCETLKLCRSCWYHSETCNLWLTRVWLQSHMLFIKLSLYYSFTATAKLNRCKIVMKNNSNNINNINNNSSTETRSNSKTNWKIGNYTRIHYAAACIS